MAAWAPAAIRAGASILGGLFGSNSSKKAADAAAEASLAGTRETNAMLREFYNRGEARTMPWINNGMTAGNTMMNFLGFGGQAYGSPWQTQGGPAPMQIGQPMQGGWNPYGGYNPYGGQQYQPQYQQPYQSAYQPYQPQQPQAPDNRDQISALRDQRESMERGPERQALYQQIQALKGNAPVPGVSGSQSPSLDPSMISPDSIGGRFGMIPPQNAAFSNPMMSMMQGGPQQMSLPSSAPNAMIAPESIGGRSGMMAPQNSSMASGRSPLVGGNYQGGPENMGPLISGILQNGGTRSNVQGAIRQGEDLWRNPTPDKGVGFNGGGFGTPTPPAYQPPNGSPPASTPNPAPAPSQNPFMSFLQGGGITMPNAPQGLISSSGFNATTPGGAMGSMATANLTELRNPGASRTTNNISGVFDPGASGASANISRAFDYGPSNSMLQLSPVGASLDSNVRANLSSAGPQMQSGYLNTAMDPGSFDNYRDSTGYQFRFDEGMEALQQAALAGGSGLASGDTLKAAIQYGQGVGSDEYQRYRSNLGDYVGYNDAFALNERGYGDSRQDLVNSQRTNFQQYQDVFGRSERDHLLGRVDMRRDQTRDQQRYDDVYAREQAGFNASRDDTRNAQRTDAQRYDDAYGMQRSGYLAGRDDTRNAQRTAAQQYRDDYAFRRQDFMGNQEARRDAQLTDFQRYGDAFGQSERNRMDNRGDIYNQLLTDAQRYGDQFAMNERGYSDARGDYGRAFQNDMYMQYLNMLQGQQGMGLQANNALLGVGTTTAGMMGNNTMRSSDIAAQAAIARGAANNQMWADIGSGIGQMPWGSIF
ncbi:MAG TPA: hypothetical protein VF389_11690 [Woeseiaceae bacterium]